MAHPTYYIREFHPSWSDTSHSYLFKIRCWFTSCDGVQLMVCAKTETNDIETTLEAILDSYNWNRKKYNYEALREGNNYWKSVDNPGEGSGDEEWTPKSAKKKKGKKSAKKKAKK